MKKLTKRPQYISTIVSEKDDPRADRACQFLAVLEAWGLEAWDFFWTSSPEIIPSPVILVTLAQLRLSDDAIVINNVVNDIPVDHVHWKTCVDRSSNSTMDLPSTIDYITEVRLWRQKSDSMRASDVTRRASHPKVPRSSFGLGP